MRSFNCTCGQTILFDDKRCGGCGAELGYERNSMRLAPLQPRPGGAWSFREDKRRPLPAYRFCVHREAPAACNLEVLITVLNEAARSMDQPETHPFALTAPVVKKLHFVHRAVHGERVAETPAPPPSLQVPPLVAH